MDDDLQHEPRDIPKLIEALDSGYDAVYGRFISRSHPTWKLIGSKVNDKVAGFLLEKPRDLYLSPFRAFRAKIKAEILRYSGPYVYVDGLILGATQKIASVNVEHHERFSGRKSLWLA
jgi:undecaprenyl-phosphate 4-deoxy-4-formamido-L-arabinose transferase